MQAASKSGESAKEAVGFVANPARGGRKPFGKGKKGRGRGFGKPTKGGRGGSTPFEVDPIDAGQAHAGA